MNTKRIFAACILTALIAAAASAQSNDRRALWQKYVGGNRVAARAPAPLVDDAAQKEDPQLQGITPKGRLEGTWLATVSFDDGFALKVLFTFMPGKDDSEGTLIDTNEFLLTPDPIGAPDQGVWQRTAERDFIATHLAFLFSSKDGSPAGTARVRDSISLNQIGNQFTGRQYVEILDPEGHFVVSFSAAMTAVKMQAEALPAP
ncbi:MAG TPA: hypothetical protein VJZ91_17450 [Blastocatellia bacterium]|nr:hypothetical protein [Blastocatellia bacterium]